jgi:hypothetical protein
MSPLSAFDTSSGVGRSSRRDDGRSDTEACAKYMLALVSSSEALLLVSKYTFVQLAAKPTRERNEEVDGFGRIYHPRW